MSQADAERRHEPRGLIELKVEYERLNTFFYDYTRNISKGGTFIKTAKPLPPGTLFLFRLFVPRLPEPLVLHGEVRWIIEAVSPGPQGHKGGSEREPGMGIRFIYEDETQRVEVDRKVEWLMVESLGPVIYSNLRNVDDT
jgi:type IV pilus assembly protein PilZ